MDQSYSLIPKEAFDLMQMLSTQGYEARLVGGCVRDMLIGKKPSDIDMAINQPPEVVMSFLKCKKLKVIPTGILHGTLTVIYKGLVVQLTSLRKDIKTNGRHAIVEYGASFEEDAKRRDFTFNALYLDKDKQLYDYFNGYRDLKEGRVRFIGSALQRIKEDYLRLWRYFRFWAYFGRGELDLDDLPPLPIILPGLLHLSGERVWEELKKLIKSPAPWKVLKHMTEYGLIQDVMNVKALKRFVIAEKKLNLGILYMLRFVALFGDQSNLKKFPFSVPLSKEEKRLWNLFQKYSSFEITMSHQKLWQQAKALEWALNDSVPCPPEWQKYKQNPPPFPLKGEDIINAGVKPGKQVGQILKCIQKEWIESDFSLSYEECLLRIKGFNI